MHLYICLPRYLHIDIYTYIDICVVFQAVQTRMIRYVQITLIVDTESNLRFVSGRCVREILSKYCKNLLHLLSAYQGQTSIFEAPAEEKVKW